MRPVNHLFLGLLLIFVTKVAPYQVCPPGTTDTKTGCQDEDECEEEERCGDNTNCFNTFGSYYCSCVPGYQTKPKEDKFTIGECRDIDECNNKTICGPNAKCYNTIASFNCVCDSGFKSSNGRKVFKANQGVKCEDVCTDGASLCGEGGVCKRAADVHECECKAGFTSYGFKNMSCTKLECPRLLSEIITAQIPEQLKPIVSELQSICAKLTRDGSADYDSLSPKVGGEAMLKILLDDIDNLLSSKPMKSNQEVTAFFKIVENALEIIGPLLHRNFNRSTHHTQLEVLVSSTTSPQSPLTMYTDTVQLDSYWETAARDTYLGFATVSLLIYHGLKKSVNGYFDWIKKQEDQNIQVNSDVVTISVTNPKPVHLEKPVTLTFSHLQPSGKTLSCAFWDSTLDGGAWSTSGCTLIRSNSSHTVCSCTQLSSLAVLALNEQEVVKFCFAAN